MVDKFSELEPTVLLALEIIDQPTTRTNLHQFLIKLEGSSLGLPYELNQAKQLSETLDTLEQKKLIRSDLSIEPRNFKYRKDSIPVEDRLVVAKLYRELKGPLRSASSLENQKLDLLARVKTAAWARDIDWLESLAEHGFHSYSYFESALLDALAVVYDQEEAFFIKHLEQTTDGNEMYVQAAILAAAAKGVLTLTQEVIALAKKWLHKTQHLIELDELCWILGCAGESFEEIDDLKVLGLKLFFKGEIVEAGKVLRGDRKRERAESFYSKLPLSGISGCVLELIDAYQGKVKYSAIMNRLGSGLSYDHDVYKHARLIIDAEYHYDPHSIASIGVWFRLMYEVLELYHEQKSLQSQHVYFSEDQAVDLFQNLKAKKQQWLRAGLTGVLEAIHADADLLKTYGLTPNPDSIFSKLEPLLDEWEAKISKLEESLGVPALGTRLTEKKSRICWRVYPNCGTVEPILQNLSKNGKWTQGRTISLRKLYEQNSDFELTELDQAICNRIVKNSGWGNQAKYSLAKVHHHISELQQHPLVFRGNAPTELATIVELQPKLLVEKLEKTLQLRLDSVTDTLMDGERFCQLNADNEIVCLPRFTDSQSLVIREVRFKTLPPIYIERMHRYYPLLKKINALVPIENFSVILDQCTDSKKADARIHALLTIDDANLYVDFAVLPDSDEIQCIPGKGEAHILTSREGSVLSLNRDLGLESTNLQMVVDELDIDLNAAAPQQVLSRRDDTALEGLENLKLAQEKGLLKILWRGKKELKSSHLNKKLVIQISSGHNKLASWFRLSGEVDVDPETKLELNELFSSLLQSRSRFVRLSDEHYLVLSAELSQQLRALGQLENEKQQGNIPPAGLLILNSLQQQGHFEIDCSKEWRAKLTAAAGKVNRKLALDKSFKAELRSYQRLGLQWLAKMEGLGFGACLADDMGLGKTIQCLAFLASRKQSGPVLIVAPTSLAINWQREAEKFAPRLEIELLDGTDRLEKLQDVETHSKIYITSYGQLVRDIERLQAIAWAVVIIDESQAIKNPLTQRAKACCKLDAQFRIALSGTPIENSMDELWSLFHFLNPGLLKTKDKFRQQFTQNLEGDSMAVLRQLISPFLLRRTKSEVLKELPPKIENTILVTPSKDEKVFYQTLQTHLVDRLATLEPQKRVFEALAGLTKLRRAACHTTLIDPHSSLPSSKHRALLTIVREAIQNKHKVLIFSQFVDHLAIVRAQLDESEIDHNYLDGKTTPKMRQKQVDNFQNSDTPVFLISLKAGGFGLNLTAADYVIHLDPWWNPAVEDQASDRSHRMGQTRSVNVYRLITAGTVEEQILRLHEQKRSLADSILSDQHDGATLSGQEIIQLLTQAESADSQMGMH